MENIPWTEKYRPNNFKTMVDNVYSINKFKKIVTGKKMPNIIISGPPGIGKTTCTLCLANNFNILKDDILELNASDERGIDIVRHKIKTFTQKKTLSNMKLIILDEADSMTSFAQQALRGIIESYKSNTKFALTCNNISNIIEPIQSRCSLVKLSKASNKSIISNLERICKIENLEFNKESLDEIANNSFGDIRQSINILQLIADSFDEINIDNVYKVCNAPHPDIIKECLQGCINNDICGVLNIVKDIINKGYNINDIIKLFINTVYEYNKLTKVKKIDVINKIISYNAYNLDIINSWVQIQGLFASIIEELNC